MSKINVLGINFDNVNMEESIEICNSFFDTNTINRIVTPNPEIIMVSRKDAEYKNLINNSNLVIPDGIGVIIAAKILRTKLKERVAGFDLINNLFKDESKEKRVYLLGSKPGIAEIASQNIENNFKVKVVGTNDGYFKNEDEQEIIDNINKSNANMLLVGMGMKKQEQFIQNYSDKMKNIRLAIGCGGSIDVFAGNVKRAPEFFQKCGLEWLYRLIKQPSRFFRMLILPKFLLLVIFRGKKLSK